MPIMLKIDNNYTREDLLKYTYMYIHNTLTHIHVHTRTLAQYISTLAGGGGGGGPPPPPPQKKTYAQVFSR